VSAHLSTIVGEVGVMSEIAGNVWLIFPVAAVAMINGALDVTGSRMDS